MPKTLGPIPARVPITIQDGSITDFFRLRWQSLIDSFLQSPTVALPTTQSGLTAAVVTAAAYTTLTAGLYRITYYVRKTVADGVSSSLTFTWGWTESGVPLTEADSALTTDTTAAEKNNSKTVWADANTDLTGAIAYASNTPAKMTYRYNIVVEQLV